MMSRNQRGLGFGLPMINSILLLQSYSRIEPVRKAFMDITYMCGCGMLADIPETIICIYFSSLLFIFKITQL